MYHVFTHIGLVLTRGIFDIEEYPEPSFRPMEILKLAFNPNFWQDY